MTASISELRQSLQSPRRSRDTVYGKLVMRPLSIFTTIFFLRLRMKPLSVTLISIFLGVLGAFFLADKRWIVGFLLANLWYLLDHTDGEMARFYNIVSPTGLYFDTISNALVHPAVFVGLGLGLFHQTHLPFWLIVGLIASYGSLMALVLPFCEATVLLQWIGEGKAVLQDFGESGNVDRPASQRVSLPRKFFSGIHYATTFPVILPLLTLAALPAALTLVPLQAIYLFYAVGVTLTWTFILANQFYSHKIDSKLRILKP